MAKRVVMGVILAAVGLGSVLSLYSFTALIMVIAFGALSELRALAERDEQSFLGPLAFVGSFAYLLLAMVGRLSQYEDVLVAVVLLVSLVWSLFKRPQGYLLRSAATLLAVLYVGKLLSYFVIIRSEPGTGAALAVMVIFLIAFTDIFAMLVGKKFGRTKLTSISPSKTVEGSLGGLLASILTGMVFVASLPALDLSLWQGASIGAMTSVAAQVGDLVESALKRDASVKDAGTALLGHGGVLDRFDSYLFGGIGFYAALFLLAHPLRGSVL